MSRKVERCAEKTDLIVRSVTDDIDGPRVAKVFCKACFDDKLAHRLKGSVMFELTEAESHDALNNSGNQCQCETEWGEKFLIDLSGVHRHR